MTTTPVTLGAGYFDGMYAAAPDPWGFEDRWYERRKYAISPGACSRRSGIAPPSSRAAPSACSPQMLAPRCDTLLACDVAAAAVMAAAGRTSDLPQVRVEQREIPGQWPPGRFDLDRAVRDLVLLRRPRPGAGPGTRRRLAASRTARCSPCTGGTRWPSIRRTGDDVHRVLAAQPGLARLAVHAEPDFLAEVYIRTDGTPASVAQATGLV